MIYDRRLNKQQVIAFYDYKNNLVGYWFTAKEAAAALGVSKTTIYNSLDGSHRTVKIKGTLKVVELSEVDL